MQDVLFKVCIFGDGGVGKTTLVNRYLTGVFQDGTKMTIGLDFHIKKLEIDDKKVTLQIWDFAGEDQFRFLLPSYVNGASGGIFMYDITRESSLSNLPNWIEVFKEGIDQKIPIIMAGGKLDLEFKRVLPKDIAMDIARANNFHAFVECSAKDGKNVEIIFRTLARAMMESSGLIPNNII
jgi:small GTP-binding protein